jgi:hypothetical protein
MTLSGFISKGKYINKISTTDMLSWFQTKVNISEFVKCFQKLNDRFYVTCKDRECKEVSYDIFCSAVVGHHI